MLRKWAIDPNLLSHYYIAYMPLKGLYLTSPDQGLLFHVYTLTTGILLYTFAIYVTWRCRQEQYTTPKTGKDGSWEKKTNKQELQDPSVATRPTSTLDRVTSALHSPAVRDNRQSKTSPADRASVPIPFPYLHYALCTGSLPGVA